METIKRFVMRGDVLVAIGIWLTAGAIPLGFHFDLNKSEWAAWVQAVGSIAAILGAIWIAGAQARRDSRSAQLMEIQMQLAFARVSRGLSQRLSDLAVDMEFSAKMCHWTNLSTAVEELVAMQPSLDSLLERATTENAVEYALLLQSENGSAIVATRKAVATKLEQDRQACCARFKSQRKVLEECETAWDPIITKLVVGHARLIQ